MLWYPKRASVQLTNHIGQTKYTILLTIFTRRLSPAHGQPPRASTSPGQQYYHGPRHQKTEDGRTHMIFCRCTSNAAPP